MSSESESRNELRITARTDPERSIQPQTPADWLFLQPGILDQLHDSIINTDLQGTIIGCNRAAAQMFGYTQQELIGQNFTIFYPEEGRDFLLASVFQTLQEKGQLNTEQRSKTKSGAEIYIQLSLTLLRDSESLPAGIVCVSQDITERRLTDVALRQTDQKLRAMAQVCPDFFFTTRVDGWTDWVSLKFYEYTGACHGEGDGLSWIDYLHPDDREKSGSKWMEAVKCGDPFEIEHRFRGRDGQYRWFRSRAIPVRNTNGELERWVGISSDVHVQKQAEQALTHHRLVLETLIESTADFIYMKDREGRYVFVNSSAARSVGKSAEEIIGKDDTALFPEESARPIMEKDHQIMSLGISEVFEETRSSAGRVRHLHSSKNVCRDASGAVIGMVGISRDITKRKQAEEALSASELNAAGARMANALAHEINNPLAAITNALFLLRHKSKAIPADELLSSAQEALWRITKITRQMIGLYNRTAPARHVQVQRVVEDTLGNLDSRIQAKDIQLGKCLEKCEFYGIDVDLRQLVTALLENAVEQSRRVVRVRLYNRAFITENSRPGFRLTIADDGPGVAAEHRHRLFEPFFSTKTEKASGLGLWMARGIVEKYGGTIRLRSTTRKGASGTCVVVVMPSHAGGLSGPGRL
ncbi:MAG TPA: PAS domain S-box protein [Candidatus Angelobacter sp.]|jgi:PAS domain S-box-containing protein